MLSCKELTDILSDYVDGRMSWSRRISFRMHLALCPGCRRYVQQFADARGAACESDACTLDDEAKRVLMERFKNWKTCEEQGQGGNED